MATGGSAKLNLPDGQIWFGPVDPSTWAAGGRLRAKQLEQDAGAAVAWHRNRPFFQGLQVNAQTIPVANTWTPLTLDWEMIDAWGGHSGSGELWYPPFTASTDPLTDYYLCSGYVPLNGSDASKIGMAGLIHNGTDIREGTKIPLVGGHVIDPMVIDLIGVQGGTDTIGLGAYTSLAAGTTTSVSSKSPSLTCRWVGSAAGFVSPAPPVPHSWIPADQASASSTGASPTPGGSKVPLNSEIRDLIRFLNFPPLARLTSEGSAQTIPSSTSAWTPIAFPTKNVDTYGGWSSGDNTKYTFQRPGVYLVIGYASIAEVSAGNDGYRAVRLQVNGDPAKIYGGTSTVPQTIGSTGTALHAARHIRVSAGDYVQVQMQHNQSASATRTVTSGPGNACRLIAVWRGR